MISIFEIMHCKMQEKQKWKKIFFHDTVKKRRRMNIHQKIGNSSIFYILISIKKTIFDEKSECQAVEDEDPCMPYLVVHESDKKKRWNQFMIHSTFLNHRRSDSAFFIKSVALCWISDPNDRIIEIEWNLNISSDDNDSHYNNHKTEWTF